jgi:WD40 repeat protein
MAVSYGWEAVSFWPVGLPYMRVLAGHTQGPVSSLSFTADSRHLVSCARDGLRVWPLRPGEGTQQRIGEYQCYGGGVSPSGDTIALAAVWDGLFVAPATTRPARRLLAPEPKTFFEQAAFDADGRRVATVETHIDDLNEHVVREVQLDSGVVRTLRYRDRAGAPPVEAPTLGFMWDGRLLVGGNDGVFLREPQAEKAAVILSTPGKQTVIAVTPDGRWLAALVGQSSGQTAQGVGGGEVVVFDLRKGTRWAASNHGADLQAVAIDASGSILATGDSSGTVRVGPATGGAVHLLVGHTTGVSAVAVSPDRRWIASASGAEVRLWPMPDLSQAPLQTLPHEQLMAKLRALTNVRVVEDARAAAGYRLETGPFPGWKDVPTW